uniref:SFRICE_000956 n=1 Tax=Spodoptera frugiperda TaxID=7108 RepID=A0A2H1VMM2_SPOFR
MMIAMSTIKSTTDIAAVSMQVSTELRSYVVNRKSREQLHSGPLVTSLTQPKTTRALFHVGFRSGCHVYVNLYVCKHTLEIRENPNNHKIYRSIEIERSLHISYEMEHLTHTNAVAISCGHQYRNTLHSIRSGSK